MSGKRRIPGKKLEAGASYDVGYGKPPESTRFKPGQSGNISGRPKGARTQRPGKHEHRIKEIITDEAYRDIAIRDGDRTISIPVMQAVIRALALGAAKGNLRQQLAFAELVATTEAARRLENEEFVKGAIEYKLHWEEELERRERVGITHLPDPLPHPDFVIIDHREGTARIIGPVNEQEKEIVVNAIRTMDRYREVVHDKFSALQTCTNPKKRKALEDEIREDFEYLNWLHEMKSKYSG